ncbi:MAG: 50S ribosomal protein L1 [bacterium]|nr:50S ribosomal protein L1 [bacterium]
MGFRGKKYAEAAKKIDNEKHYVPTDAIELVKGVSNAKFDETIEVHFNLGIDPRHADQLVRGTIILPHGTGKDVRVVVICEGENQKLAEKAGANEVGSDDLIEKISGGFLDFDVLIASPDMMAKVGKLGRVLGARGLMPSPKSGTVTPDVVKAVTDFKAGKVEYRNDKNGIIHSVIGKASFDSEKLRDNFVAIYEVIEKAKPSKSKGVYMRSIVLAPTMGPGVKVESQKNKWEVSA